MTGSAAVPGDPSPGGSETAAAGGAVAPVPWRAQLATWPNLFTLLRLVAIPVFVWLLFGRHNRAAAAWLLGALGSTDWVDGWLARKLGQTTELGAMFDPIVDRLLFFVAVPSLVIDGSVPLLVAIVLLVREAVVALVAVALKASGAPRLVVTWEGKTGTFLLMFAVPLFLGYHSTLSYAPALVYLAWLFAVPGIAYSWYSALFQYLPTAARRRARTAEAYPRNPKGSR